MTAIDTELAQHAQAVLTEAVSNAVRHSGATRLTIEVTVADELCINVRDDGRGIPADNQRQSGLANMRRRAEQVARNMSSHLAGRGRNHGSLDRAAYRVLDGRKRRRGQPRLSDLSTDERRDERSGATAHDDCDCPPRKPTERLFSCSPMTRLLLPTSMIMAIRNGAMVPFISPSNRAFGRA